MAMYVAAPKDLTKIKTRIVFNLSKRQLICFSAAGAAGLPAYLLTNGVIGSSAAALLMIAVMLPLFFVAMYERDGQPAEIVLRNFLRARFFWPRVRVYKTENLYGYLGKEAASEAQTETPRKRGKWRKTAKKHATA